MTKQTFAAETYPGSQTVRVEVTEILEGGITSGVSFALDGTADIDALIAALREARDALAGDEERDWQAWDAELATPNGQAKLVRLAARDAARDDIPDDAYNGPTGTPEQSAADYAALGLPAPSRAMDAATDAATVRLTRAQRRVLEHVSRYEDSWTQTRSAASVDGALAELSALGYIEATQTSEYREWTLTPLGRAALAAAQRETGDGARESAPDAGMCGGNRSDFRDAV